MLLEERFSIPREVRKGFEKKNSKEMTFKAKGKKGTETDTNTKIFFIHILICSMDFHCQQ